MRLSITATFSNDFQIGVGNLTATIKVFAMTMSLVVELVFTTPSGATKKAVVRTQSWTADLGILSDAFPAAHVCVFFPQLQQVPVAYHHR